MLAAFTAGLIFFRWAGANGLADTALAARLVIALSVAAGVGAAWREARPRRQGEIGVRPQLLQFLTSRILAFRPDARAE